MPLSPRHQLTNPTEIQSIESIPLENPLLPNPCHELHNPFPHSPLPARSCQYSLLLSTITRLWQQHKLIDILPIRRASLPRPLVFAEVHAGEVSRGVRGGAGGGDGDRLGREGVLGCYGVEAVRGNILVSGTCTFGIWIINHYCSLL